MGALWGAWWMLADRHRLVLVLEWQGALWGALWVHADRHRLVLVLKFVLALLLFLLVPGLLLFLLVPGHCDLHQLVLVRLSVGLACRHRLAISGVLCGCDLPGDLPGGGEHCPQLHLYALPVHCHRHRLVLMHVTHLWACGEYGDRHWLAIL